MNLSEMERTWRGSPLAVPGEPGQGKIWGEYEGQRSKVCRAITVRGVALPRCRGRHQPVAAAFPAQILGNFATAPGDEPHECADPSRGACTGVMSRRAYSAKGGRACGRATEEFDVAQLRAGGHDRAHDVGGGHATRESRRCPLRTRRAKAAMSCAAISHLWAVTGVGPSLSELDPGRAWGHAGPVCSSSAN